MPIDKHDIKILILFVVTLALIGYTIYAVQASPIEEIEDFLVNDTTDIHEYLPWYSCGHFSRDLAKNASEVNLTIGSSICGNHPVFRGHQNHIINYVEINDTLYFIEPQTDHIMQLDDVFMQYQYIRLYPDGTQVPSNWNCNLAPTIRFNLFEKAEDDLK